MRLYNPRTHVESLLVSPISKASAMQRARAAQRAAPAKFAPAKRAVFGRKGCRLECGQFQAEVFAGVVQFVLPVCPRLAPSDSVSYHLDSGLLAPEPWSQLFNAKSQRRSSAASGYQTYGEGNHLAAPPDMAPKAPAPVLEAVAVLGVTTLQMRFTTDHTCHLSAVIDHVGVTTLQMRFTTDHTCHLSAVIDVGPGTLL
ncbi:unnamed protein product [Effrenium voratum]|nr:unnamed protein product [Effrenium voratum]